MRRTIMLPNIFKNDVKIYVDPLGKFPEVPMMNILNACGFIPEWLINEPVAEPIMDMLNRVYPYGIPMMSGGTIEKDGVHKYPNDPDLYPLIKVERGDDVIYQYEHAIVAIVFESGAYYITRMD